MIICRTPPEGAVCASLNWLARFKVNCVMIIGVTHVNLHTTASNFIFYHCMHAYKLLLAFSFLPNTELDTLGLITGCRHSLTPLRISHDGQILHYYFSGAQIRRALKIAQIEIRICTRKPRARLYTPHWATHCGEKRPLSKTGNSGANRHIGRPNVLC